MRYSILGAVAVVLLSLYSCTEHEVKDFQVEKPESLVKREKLDKYEALNQGCRYFIKDIKLI